MRKSNKYWVLAGIKDHIFNVRAGVDMCDYSFGILYNDGTTLEVTGNELPEGRIIIGEAKVKYCWYSDPDDSYDSLGKAWQKDFLNGLSPSDEGAEITINEWDRYVSINMESSF